MGTSNAKDFQQTLKKDTQLFQWKECGCHDGEAGKGKKDYFTNFTKPNDFTASH